MRRAALLANTRPTHQAKPHLAKEIVLLPLPELKPFPDNPRKHSEAQIVSLARSIKDNPWTNPILIDEERTILSGHGRMEAATRLGLSQVPTITLAGCTPAQKRAIVIGENRHAENATWDHDKLKIHLESLIELNFDVELSGFTTGEVDIILDGNSGSQVAASDDALPELPTSAVSVTGDLWLLGEHSLLCGDSRDTGSYRTLLGTERAQLILTDPPYNVKIWGHARGNGKTRHREFSMASGEMSDTQFVRFLETVIEQLVTFSSDGSIHYIFIDWRHLPALLRGALPLYSEWKQLLVWNKLNGGQGNFYRSQHELIGVFKKGSSRHINNFGLGATGRYRTNVLNHPGMAVSTADNLRERDLHPTVKPVGLLADLIRDCSHRKRLVLDPFAGSGSVILAAERAGRIARAVEIDPLYVDVAIARWQKMTGDKALLAGSRRTFDQVAEHRSGSEPPSKAGALRVSTANRRT
jgi:DNA modification methylase